MRKKNVTPVICLPMEIKLPFASERFKEAWETHLAIRKDKGCHHYVDSAVNALFKRLLAESHNEEVLAIWLLEDANSRGWATLFYNKPPQELIRRINERKQLRPRAATIVVNRAENNFALSTGHSTTAVQPTTTIQEPIKPKEVTLDDKRKWIQDSYNDFLKQGRSAHVMLTIYPMGTDLLLPQYAEYCKDYKHFIIPAKKYLKDIVYAELRDKKITALQAKEKENSYDIPDNGAVMAYAKRLCLLHAFEKLQQQNITQLFTT